MIVGQERQMSMIYGAEHLLRLLGEFFSGVNFLTDDNGGW